MEHKVWAQGVRRKEIDLEKLALAYYLVARSLIDKRQAKATEAAPAVVQPEDQKAA